MTDISFETTEDEAALITDISFRFARLLAKHCPEKMTGEEGARVRLSTRMDLSAVHANGCPLDLERLKEADDVNFLHDVVGIDQHLNRDTGQLGNCFLPRFAKKEPTSSPRAQPGGFDDPTAGIHPAGVTKSQR